MDNKPRIRLFGVLLKALVLLLLFNFAFQFFKDIPLGKLTLYNSILPGRQRFPFGETRESYNLSLFNPDAMFASHILAGTEKTADEYRVLLIGDSSVWGTLLTPEQTLAGQLNAHPITACGKTARKKLPAIRERVQLVESGEEILPGIQVIEAFGHTPGHMSLEVQSQGEALLHLADAALHEIHVEHPDWYAPVDMNPEQMIATRYKLLERAATSGA